jgi:hypothetical protein
MRQTSLDTILVFAAGLGIGYFARSAKGTVQRKHAADLAAIEKLHQQDIEVTAPRSARPARHLGSGCGALQSQRHAAVGKQAIGAENEKVRAQYPNFTVLSYAAKYKNIQIEDGLACEWGVHEGQCKLTPESAPLSFSAKGIHVLKRQSDASWKFAVPSLTPDWSDMIPEIRQLRKITLSGMLTSGRL